MQCHDRGKVRQTTSGHRARPLLALSFARERERKTSRESKRGRAARQGALPALVSNAPPPREWCAVRCGGPRISTRQRLRDADANPARRDGDRQYALTKPRTVRVRTMPG